MLKKLSVLSATTLLFLLVACGQEDAVPVVRATPNASGGVSSFQVEMRTTYKNGDGLVGESPRGLLASYLVQGDDLTMRLDIPRAMYPDNQARILVHDTASDSTLFLLKEGLRPDPYVSGEAFNEFFTNGVMDLTTALSDRPFMRMSADSFTQRAKLAAFDIVKTEGTRVTATQAKLTSAGSHTMTLHFDTEVGAVTGIEEITVTEEMIQSTEADISHVEVEGIEDGVVPYKIDTKVTMELKADIAPVVLPEADEIIEISEGEIEEDFVPDIPEGMVLVDESIGMAGEGPVDMNKVEIEQTVHYEDIKVNELSADFFLLGGQ